MAEALQANASISLLNLEGESKMIDFNKQKGVSFLILTKQGTTAGNLEQLLSVMH